MMKQTLIPILLALISAPQWLSAASIKSNQIYLENLSKHDSEWFYFEPGHHPGNQKKYALGPEGKLYIKGTPGDVYVFTFGGNDYYYGVALSGSCIRVFQGSIYDHQCPTY